LHSETVSINAGSRQPRIFERLTAAQLAAWLAAAGIIAVTRVLFVPQRFADYETYVLLIDNVYHGMSRLGFTVEPVFAALFLAVRVITGNTDAAADLLQYGLTALFLLSLYFLIRAYRAEWPAVFVTLGLFAPLLAFVTIRATPAYAVMALAVLFAFQGRLITIPALLVAGLFHPSSVLGVIPVLILLAQRRYGWLGWLNTHASRIIAVLVVLAVIATALQTIVVNAMLDALSSIGQLSKYIVYLESTEVSSQSGTIDQVSIYDRIYSMLIVITTVVAFAQKEPRMVVMRSYILVSFTIFLLLSFSPVAAFRQSIFWFIPLLLTFPWRSAGVRGPVALGLMLASVALFIFQLSSVLA